MLFRYDILLVLNRPPILRFRLTYCLQLYWSRKIIFAILTGHFLAKKKDMFDKFTFAFFLLKPCVVWVVRQCGAKRV